MATRYVYHYHLTHQSVPGSIANIDGTFSTLDPVLSQERYDIVKSLLAGFAGPGVRGCDVTVTSLTLLGTREEE